MLCLVLIPRSSNCENKHVALHLSNKLSFLLEPLAHISSGPSLTPEGHDLFSVLQKVKSENARCFCLQHVAQFTHRRYTLNIFSHQTTNKFLSCLAGLGKQLDSDHCSDFVNSFMPLSVCASDIDLHVARLMINLMAFSCWRG